MTAIGIPGRITVSVLQMAAAGRTITYKQGYHVAKSLEKTRDRKPGDMRKSRNSS